MMAADVDPLLSSSDIVGIVIDVIVGSQIILIRSGRSLSSSMGRDTQGTSPSMVGVGAAFESFSSSSDSISKIVLGKIDHLGASSSSDTDSGTVSATMDSSSLSASGPSSNLSLSLSIVALAFFLKLLFLGNSLLSHWTLSLSRSWQNRPPSSWRTGGVLGARRPRRFGLFSSWWRIPSHPSQSSHPS